jgi:hypothetical protein
LVPWPVELLLRVPFVALHQTTIWWSRAARNIEVWMRSWSNRWWEAYNPSVSNRYHSFRGGARHSSQFNTSLHFSRTVDTLITLACDANGALQTHSDVLHQIRLGIAREKMIREKLFSAQGRRFTSGLFQSMHNLPMNTPNENDSIPHYATSPRTKSTRYAISQSLWSDHSW